VSDTGRRLAVLGSPIAHSQSPALHRAAYRLLGLDWRYDAIEVTAAELPGFIRRCGPEWRGLSVTMPLKNDIVPLADSVDDTTELTGAANTVVFDRNEAGSVLRVFNTDVRGIEQAFARAGADHLDSVLILGGGATAASATVAAARLGAREISIAVRTPAKASPLTELASRCGASAHVVSFADIAAVVQPDAVISTLPGGAHLDRQLPAAMRKDSVLFDVAYDPWPSALAQDWLEAGGRVIPGIDMLILQALVQIRIFVTGDPDVPLAREADVVATMRAAVGLAPDGSPA